jgi:sugar phosphate isomerase/epimerase
VPVFGYNVPFDVAPAALAAVAGTGFGHLELRVDESPIAGFWTPGRVDALRRAAGEPGLTLSLHASRRINPADTSRFFDAPSVVLAKKSVELAARLGAGWVNFHVGTGYDRDTHRRRQRALAAAADFFAR